MDDGSTDSSPAILDNWAIEEARVKVVHKANEGVRFARNCGIKEATGDFIMFVDSDDWIDPRLLSDFSERQKSSDAEIFVYGFKRIDENGEIQREEFPESSWKKADLLNESEPLAFLLWNKIYARNVFVDISYKYIEEIEFAEDTYLTCQLMSNTEKFEFIPEAYYFWFVRTGSFSQKMSDTKEKYHIKIAAEFQAALKLESEPKVCLIKKLNAKAHLINPDREMSRSEFFSNCAEWNSLFPEADKILSEYYTTKLMRTYIFFIRRKNYAMAYALYRLRNRIRARPHS